MRLAILFARKHGDNEPLILVQGPASPSDANLAFKEAVCDPEFAAGFSEIQLWTSDCGLQKRKQFSAPGAPQTTNKQKESGDTRQAAESESAGEETSSSEAEQPASDEVPGGKNPSLRRTK